MSVNIHLHMKNASKSLIFWILISMSSYVNGQRCMDKDQPARLQKQ